MRSIKILLVTLLLLNSLYFVTYAASSNTVTLADPLPKDQSGQTSETKTFTNTNSSVEKLLGIMDEVDNTIIRFNSANDPVGSPLSGSLLKVFAKTIDKNGNIITDYHYANGTIASIDNYIGGVKYTTFYRTGSFRDGMTVTTYGSQKEGFDANQVYDAILQGKYDFKKNPSNVIMIHLTDVVYNMDINSLKEILSNKYATDKQLTDFINLKNRLELGWVVIGYLKSPADGSFYGCALKYYDRYPESRTYAGNKVTFSIPTTVYSNNSNVSGYVKGSAIGMNNGHSMMTVDNSKNRSSVSGKLYNVSGGKLSPARKFYVNKGESFTLENLSPGTYELHYGLVSSGSYYKTDRIKISETASSYTKCTLTLYTVTNGNTRVYKIKSSEF